MARKKTNKKKKPDCIVKKRKPKVEKRIRLSIKKGDVVQIIAGKEKGKSGKVLSVNASTLRILVEGLNKVKRHIKPTQKNPQGGIVEKESPVHYSNVLLFSSKKNRGYRHGFKMIEDTDSKKKTKNNAVVQKKARVFRPTGEVVDGK